MIPRTVARAGGPAAELAGGGVTLPRLARSRRPAQHGAAALPGRRRRRRAGGCSIDCGPWKPVRGSTSCSCSRSSWWAVCSPATEIALVSLRDGQVERLDTQGGHAGTRSPTLARDPNRFLSAVQIGVTVAGLLLRRLRCLDARAVLRTRSSRGSAPPRHPDTVSLIVTTLVVSYLSLVLGELVPKRLALQRSVGVAQDSSPPAATASSLPLMTPGHLAAVALDQPARPPPRRQPRRRWRRGRRGGAAG